MVFRLLEIQLLSWRCKHNDRWTLFAVYLLRCVAAWMKKTVVVSSSSLSAVPSCWNGVSSLSLLSSNFLLLLLLLMFSWCLESLSCKFYDFIAFRKHLAKGLQLKISNLANTLRKHFRFMCIILETENKLSIFESFTFLIVCCSCFDSHSSVGQFSFFHFFLSCRHIQGITNIKCAKVLLSNHWKARRPSGLTESLQSTCKTLISLLTV